MVDRSLDRLEAIDTPGLLQSWCFWIITTSILRCFMSDSAWQVFQLEDLKTKVAGDEPRFFEFLRVPAISGAVYRLPVGARDMQAPHLEDEIYIVTEGRARLRVGDQEHDVGPGTILFVRATAEHSFFDIEEDLTLLAFFGSSNPPWDQ